jgi:hypothetical protein
MIKLLICMAGAVMLSGCAGVIEKQEPICSGTAIVGGQENTSRFTVFVNKITRRSTEPVIPLTGAG